jgi:subtilisin family serine protease
MLLVAAACAPRSSAPQAPEPVPAVAMPDHTALPPTPARAPLLPPQAAMLMGLMPRRSVGVDRFLAAHPSADGRGVLIAILDSGVDAALPGLARTTTGARKLLDVRDFSGEGRVALAPLEPAGDAVTVQGMTLSGLGTVRALAVPPFYGGILRERPLGESPAADLNGDGDDADTMAIVVAQASDGWVLFADTDGDGSLAGEAAIHDYSVAGERFAYGPVTLVANLRASAAGRPALDLVFDTSGHGSHVAGIAAGHRLFDVPGFDGAAPGAQLLALKIANNARGGVSVTGAMLAALDYAAGYAAARSLPLVVNLSFGVGNEDAAGVAAIDSAVDAFAQAHPDVLVVISAGNDGPGISTVGFPGSAEFALTACALFPGVFAEAPTPGSRHPEDVLGWWSGRGGEHAKPDLCVPGVAFSNVPAWHTGHEVSGGTSMAAPMLSGLAALVQSALIQGNAPPATAFELHRALAATARPLPGASVIEQGAGVPDVGAAFRWLRAGHRAGRFSVRALPDGGNRGHTAAYRPHGLAPDDSTQTFSVTSLAGQPFARLLLRSDAPWLRAPDALDFGGAPATVTVRYDRSQLLAPGLYVGTVWARPATDTLAGAAFGLTSTLIVPQPLTAAYRLRKYLRAGRAEHLFFEIPDHAGGLQVRVAVADQEQHASLYLFEPGGRPYRGGSSVEVGGEQPKQEIAVRGDDVVPGVYEVVLAAPPTAGVTFDLTVALPPVALALDHQQVTLSVWGDRPVPTSLTTAVIGASRVVELRGSGTETRRIPVRVPPWATALVVDVRLPERVWTRVTDFALSAWDSAGRLVMQQPLNYAVGRHQIPVDSVPDQRLEIELFPAFALPDDTTAWEASVRLSFVAANPLDADPPRAVRPGPDHPAVITLPPLGAAVPMPDGFSPLLEATAQPEEGAPSARRGSISSATGVPGATR